MPSDDADGIGSKAAGAVNPGGNPRDVRGVIGLMGDVSIIDEQAQQPYARRFQVEAELFKAVIGWVIDMKMAELQHCVAVVCCGRNGIFQTKESRGWLKKQGIRRTGAARFHMANQRVEGPGGNAGEEWVYGRGHTVGAFRLRSLSIP
jgi:hypothetical protein